ncbi:UNKNOWN [Stylonychia lemnae]|uniref:Uncharacterized protein n=1 Tax=Stylonychia lemnae TaxID=5949 RepID=A0A078APP3_STYLE|nr:UNKNOWN [Stylonychia lemnae]|eukprot:CDW82878.1 UNKNOWN [Stylonychia lemnae]
MKKSQSRFESNYEFSDEERIQQTLTKNNTNINKNITKNPKFQNTDQILIHFESPRSQKRRVTFDERCQVYQII